MKHKPSKEWLASIDAMSEETVAINSPLARQLKRAKKYQRPLVDNELSDYGQFRDLIRSAVKRGGIS